MMSGIIASAIYSGTIVGLVEIGGFAVMPATVVAFVAGTLVAWLANSRFSFREPLRAATLVRFSMVRIVAFVLNLAIMKATIWLNFPYGVGIAVTLVLLPPFNFLLHRLWTFRKEEGREDRPELF